jgi:DNA mismatch repair protein MutS
MKFESILYEKPEDRSAGKPELPDFFTDLNLDQIVDAVVKGKQEYNLKPFFWSPLSSLRAVQYRQEIMQELQQPQVKQIIQNFALGMHNMRDYLARADKLFYVLQKQRWFIDAANLYCDSVDTLFKDLSAVTLKSQGFQAFRDFLKEYTASDSFTSLAKDTKQLKADLAAINYCIQVKGKNITVRRYESELDYTASVEKTFAKFRQEEVNDYQAKFTESPELNTLEVQVLESVEKLYSDVFDNLDDYCGRYPDFPDGTITAFDREVQFYVSYLDLVGSIQAKGLSFCYPLVSDTSKEILLTEGFDLALANKYVADDRIVVCNDFFLKGPERIFVISGPNQGGKTTFARAFGQSHYLASLGCPVQGKEARLFLFDRLFTHFEKEENVEDLKSRLEDDLTRVHAIVSAATPHSIIIANEILTSTTLNDAIFLGKKVMESLSRLDLLCVWVTFVEELSTYNDKTVSLVSLVAPDNPAVRTYKIVRKPAQGLSYAIAIAEKYSLTYGSLKERIK